MINLFRHDHIDADELNALLDAMRSGSRNPETSREELGELLRTASQFRELADRAASVTPAPAKSFDVIWEDMMSGHTIAASTTTATGPANRIDDATHRVHPVREMPRAGWLQSLVSAAILVVVLAGLVAAAWNLRDGNGGTSGPGDDIRLAAPGLDTGTPDATAEPGFDWTRLISADECVAAGPMSESDIIEITRDPEGYPLPTYGPISSPSPSDAEDAVQAARVIAACDYAGDGTDAYSTAAYIWRYSSPSSPLYNADQRMDFMEVNGRQVTQELSDIEPGDLLLPAKGNPDRETVVPMTYLPENTVEFADGRLGVLSTFFIISPEFPEMPDTYYMMLIVLSDESGQWLLDDGLPICIGECSDYLNGAPWDGNNSQLMEVGVSATPLATPRSDASTPDATAEDDVDFYSYVDPRTCTAKPVLTPAERRALLDEEIDWPLGDYGQVSPADASDARDAALVAREVKACIPYIVPESLMTQQMLWLSMRTVGTPGFEEFAKQRDTLEREVSSLLTDLRPEDVFSLTDEVPTGGQSQNVLVFTPDHAVQFPDGRIGIPGTFLIPRSATYRNDPPRALMTEFDILKNEDGQWLLDEQLSVCIGDCADYINGGPQPYWDLKVNPNLSTPAVRSVKPATPVSTPAADATWTQWITAEDCTPPASGRIWAVTDSSEYTLAGAANLDDAEAAAKAARMDEACSFATSRHTLDEYSDVVFDINESFSDRATRQQSVGKAIADLHPIENVADYFVFTDCQRREPPTGIRSSQCPTCQRTQSSLLTGVSESCRRSLFSPRKFRKYPIRST